MRGETKGKVYLVGAGPGDPELLTLKAARILGECNVVLYDRLVSVEVLSMARADAELIYVGKHSGQQERTQAQIFELIRRFATEGKKIARLKGGDPLIFGRGGEEWKLAFEHGIDVEVIPGISSAIALPGMAGVPLTFRGISQNFAVITGHSCGELGQDWRSFASVDTLVVLMGANNRRFIAQALIDAGRGASEPVAFIERGTLPNERVVETTLADIARGAVEIESPAVMIVGEVVRLRDSLIKEQAQPELSPAFES